MPNIIYLYALMIVCSMIQAGTGFGAATIMMNFYPLFFPYDRAVAICQMIVIVFNVVYAVGYRKKIRWDLIGPMIVPATVIALVFTLISVSIDLEVMKLMLGTFFVCIALYNIVWEKRVHIKPTKKMGILMGCASGLFNAFFSIAGPPAALYLAPITNDKEEYHASIQCFFTFSSTACLAVRVASGIYRASDIPVIAIGWVCTLVGMFAGIKVFSKLKFDLMKKIIYGFVGLNGLWIVIQHFI